MNYKAELKGFAFDRAREIAKANGGVHTPADIIKMSDEIIEYCYVPHKDIDDHIGYLFELLRKHGEVEKIDALTQTLGVIREELERDKKVREVVKETMQ